MSEPIKFPDKGSLNTYIWLPVTMPQFQDLCNELLKMANDQVMSQEVVAGRDPAGLGFNADHYALHLIGAIHSSEVKSGKVLKSYLFDACWCRMSKNLTYAMGQDIQERLNPKSPAEVLPDEVTNEVTPPTGPVA